MPLPDGSNWSKTALPWMSIGYETQIPPITTVNFYNGIANNGKLLRPRLVKAILKDGEVVKEYPVVVLRERMAKPEAIKNIQDCLESVVSQGLGKKAGSKHLRQDGHSPGLDQKRLRLTISRLLRRLLPLRETTLLLHRLHSERCPRLGRRHVCPGLQARGGRHHGTAQF